MSFRQLKRRWITGPAIAIAALVPMTGAVQPASANPPPPGEGVVTGIVSSSGVPVGTGGTINCSSAVVVHPKAGVTTVPFVGLGTTFRFDATLITGTVNVGPEIAAGTVDVTASGGGCDSAELGHGTVTASCGPSTAVTASGVATIGCNLSGTYDRIGTTVTVNLSGRLEVTVNGTTYVDATAKVDVVAQFIPAGPPAPGPCHGYTACIYTAAFAGPYVQTA